MERKKITILWISIISDLSPLEGDQVCNDGGVCELLGADSNPPTTTVWRGSRRAHSDPLMQSAAQQGSSPYVLESVAGVRGSYHRASVYTERELTSAPD